MILEACTEFLRQPRAIERGFNAFVSKYNTPAYDFDINVARIVVAAFFIWKLLSRDFSFYGIVPENVFPFYPKYIYSSSSYILTTGQPILSELATFHWVHWFLPHPTPEVFVFIQFTAVALLVCLLFFGRGPRNIMPILCYILLIYLWGYLFLGAQEVDAILLYFGLLLILAFTPYNDRPIWAVARLYGDEPNVRAGRTRSLLFLLFVFYYFASGVNKITDLSPVGWFNYDLIEAMELYSIRAEFSTTQVPGILELLFPYKFLNLIGPPLIYASHLIVPTVFFVRSSVFKFFLFYSVFHFLAFGVGISFTGYILVWLVLFPHREILATIGRRFPINYGSASWQGRR